MIEIRTVCTHDAKKLANTLVRLLEAEQHRVRLIFGRQSLAELEGAKSAREAVLIIWSPDAPSQTYMLEWAHNIDPSRLIEIALAPGWPRINRKAPVIDFSGWRGERGARAWNALNERLRAVARVLEPPRPQKHAALALGLASMAAVGVAAVVRVNDTPAPPEPTQEPFEMTMNEEVIGLGGALVAIEPPSADEPELQRLPNPRFTPLQPAPEPALMPIEPYTMPEIRDPTLLERLSALNPLRLDGRGDD